MKAVVSAVVTVLLLAGPSAALTAEAPEPLVGLVAVADPEPGTTGFFNHLICAVLKKRC